MSAVVEFWFAEVFCWNQSKWTFKAESFTSKTFVIACHSSSKRAQGQLALWTKISGDCRIRIALTEETKAVPRQGMLVLSELLPRQVENKTKEGTSKKNGVYAALAVKGDPGRQSHRHKKKLFATQQIVALDLVSPCKDFRKRSLSLSLSLESSFLSLCTHVECIAFIHLCVKIWPNWRKWILEI